MIVIGEKLNSSIPSVYAAIEKKDSRFVSDLAVKQEEAGAHFLDINAGMFVEAEEENLRWLMNTVQAVSQLPFQTILQICFCFFLPHHLRLLSSICNIQMHVQYAGSPAPAHRSHQSGMADSASFFSSNNTLPLLKSFFVFDNPPPQPDHLSDQSSGILLPQTPGIHPVLPRYRSLQYDICNYILKSHTPAVPNTHLPVFHRQFPHFSY